MSKRALYRYELELEQQRRLQLARIRETTQRSCAQYAALYEKMVREGYEEYIPRELKRVRRDLTFINNALESDPESARDTSVELGECIAKLPALARATRREFEKRYRAQVTQLVEEKTHASSELADFLDEQVRSLQDAVVRDFAFDSVRALKKELAHMEVAPGKLSSLKETLRQRIEAIRENAEEQAAEWKARKETELRSETEKSFLEMQREQIAADLKENPTVLEGVLADLSAVQERLEQGVTEEPADLREKVKEVVDQAEAAVMDERYRKETVNAVVRSLREAGFVLVCKPKRCKDGDRDEVVLQARQPTGHQAEFRVTLSGDFSYCFDGYEGATCKTDIVKVLAKLQDIYGVTLSDERVIWENPDRVSRSAKPVSTGKGGAKDGSE
jgi:hypothetical protein